MSDTVAGGQAGSRLHPPAYAPEAPGFTVTNR